MPKPCCDCQVPKSRDQISFPFLAWSLKLRYDCISALDWRETVEFTVFDRKSRKGDFPRRNVLYQQARKLYHAMRRGQG